MNISLTQIFIATVMIGVAFAFVFLYREYLASNSQRRMIGMLVSVGLDPTITVSGDAATIMKDVRKRCSACASEDVCERWLNSDDKGDNSFCPNSKVFAILKRRSQWMQ